MKLSPILRFALTPAVALIGLAGVGLAPAPSTLPDTSGEGIIHRFVEVTGGKDNYAKINTRVITGTIAMPQQGLTGDITIYQKAPNLTRAVGNVGGITFDRGFDGHVAFEVNSMQGTRLIEGSERDFMEQQSLSSPLAALERAFKSVENVGIEPVDGRDAYKVEMTTKKDDKFAQWYDVDSGLLVQMEFAMDTPMGKLDMLMAMSDWKEIGDVKVPSKMKQTIQPIGIEQNLDFTKIENNVDIPAEKFELPDEVKDLVKANAAATQPAATQPAGGK